jgi:hypothetical protein
VSAREPARKPCATCPYRRDVPSGVWAPDEYTKLPPYDEETPYQPMGLFHCHQQDGRLCAGWVGCHDMEQNLAVRIGVSTGSLSEEVLDAVLDYSTEVPLFASGQEAAEHGLAGVEAPPPEAHQAMAKVLRRRQAQR